MSKIVCEHYEVRDPIGVGAMGTVYRGWDMAAQLPVAVKILHANATEADPMAIQRFLREGLLVRQLDHPNIVKVFTTAADGGEYVMVMELIEGVTLRQYIDTHHDLPIKRTIEIALILCDALAQTHAINIVHRDIKPQNVLIDAAGTPFLTDFGLALASDLESLTKSRNVLGTLPYMSPEALQVSPLDGRADLWSLGVLLYEMLTGEMPFRAPSAGELIFQMLAQPPRRPVMVARPDCPPALSALVDQLLAKDRDQRPPTARAVIDVLLTLMH